MPFSRPLTTEADHDAALAAIEPYFRKPPARGTPAAARYDALFALIEAWEAVHHPIPDDTPAALPDRAAAGDTLTSRG
jgi:HTH-type transcriptional regulator/antitoxin HigA